MCRRSAPAHHQQVLLLGLWRGCVDLWSIATLAAAVNPIMCCHLQLFRQRQTAAFCWITTGQGMTFVFRSPASSQHKSRFCLPVHLISSGTLISSQSARPRPCPAKNLLLDWSYLGTLGFSGVQPGLQCSCPPACPWPLSACHLPVPPLCRPSSAEEALRSRNRVSHQAGCADLGALELQQNAMTVCRECLELHLQVTNKVCSCICQMGWASIYCIICMELILLSVALAVIAFSQRGTRERGGGGGGLYRALGTGSGWYSALVDARPELRRYWPAWPQDHGTPDSVALQLALC